MKYIGKDTILFCHDFLNCVMFKFNDSDKLKQCPHPDHNVFYWSNLRITDWLLGQSQVTFYVSDFLYNLSRQSVRVKIKRVCYI